MAMNIRKQNYLSQVQSVAGAFVQLQKSIDVLGQLMFEEFGAGRDNEITDADLVAFGLTQYKLALIKIVADQLNNFWNGQEVTAQANGQFVREIASN